MQSCLYQGAVAHHRRKPVDHRFRYSLVMAYLDLDEIEQVVGPGKAISSRRFAGVSFLRDDRLFKPKQPLGDEVRSIVHEQAGIESTGPIRVLTQLRWLGYYFSPLNLYYVFDPAGERVKAIVAEVNNTPWGERHAYVLSEQNRLPDETMLRHRHGKNFHVSPFMGMDANYRWRLSTPSDALRVSLAYEREDKQLFDANMVLRRVELTPAAVRRILWRYPVMTAQVSAAIYYQALKLWWKRCPYFPHPQPTESKPLAT